MGLFLDDGFRGGADEPEDVLDAVAHDGGLLAVRGVVGRADGDGGIEDGAARFAGGVGVAGLERAGAEDEVDVIEDGFAGVAECGGVVVRADIEL